MGRRTATHDADGHGVAAMMISREVESYSLPLPSGVTLLNTHKIVLKILRGYSIDFGAWCYLRRSDKKRLRGKGREVVIESRCPIRTEQVAKLIAQVVELSAGGQFAPITLSHRYKHFEKFLFWCDANGRSDVLHDVSSARRSIHAYVLELRREIFAGTIANNAAAELQTSTIRVLQEHHGAYDLDRGLNLIRENNVGRMGTPVPSDEAVGRLVGFCSYIFTGLSDLVLSNEPYPFRLKMPPFLGWPGDSLWIFPGRRWRVTPEETLPQARGGYNFALDYKNGRVRDVEEIRDSYFSVFTAQKAVRNTQQRIQEANANQYHDVRLKAATTAMEAFAIIFIAATGMNYAPFQSLPWSEELTQLPREPIVERRHFRTIKYRANNKEVTFAISLRFIPMLRRYLELREWILRGRTSDYLFFGFHDKYTTPIASIEPSQVSRQYLYDFLDVIETMTAQVPRVTARELRSAKQDFLIRHFDPVTASSLMQHSLRTATKKYSKGSETLAQEEMGDYLSQVEETVLKRGEDPRGSAARPTGLCIKEDNPRPIMIDPPAKPNCKDQEGCLYCDKYRVHADEADARKLLSLHYCLRQTAHFAASAEEHAAVFGHLLTRIDSLLDQICNKSPEMVAPIKRIRKEVDEDGKLDAYWAAKLDFLYQLGDLIED